MADLELVRAQLTEELEQHAKTVIEKFVNSLTSSDEVIDERVRHFCDEREERDKLWKKIFSDLKRPEISEEPDLGGTLKNIMEMPQILQYIKDLEYKLELLKPSSMMEAVYQNCKVNYLNDFKTTIEDVIQAHVNAKEMGRIFTTRERLESLGKGIMVEVEKVVKEISECEHIGVVKSGETVDIPK